MPMDDLGSGEFDMQAALSEMSSGLGFESESSGAGEGDNDDLQLEMGDAELKAAEAAAGAGTSDQGAETPEVTSTPAAPAVEPPKTWRKEALAHWEALPAEVRDEVLKREQDMFKGIEAYKTDATFGRSLKTALDPYMPILQQYNIDPAAQVANLMQAHHTLALGAPEQKVAFMRQLAQEYGIDLAQLSGDGEVFVDPAVQSLQKELQVVKSELSARQQREMQAKVQAIQAEIEQFAAKPENEYFDEVANDIAALVKSGAATTLADAYEKAIWANPVTRAKALAKQQAETAAKAKAEAAARAKAASAASSVVVRAKPNSASGTAPSGSMDDTMQEILADISRRG
jgi:hypothetical protein